MREVVDRYFEIMNRLEIDALGELFADDVVFRLPFAPEPVPQRTEGKEAVLQVYSGFPDLVSPLGFHDIEIRPLAAEGEYVAEYRSDCTMLPTGAPYRNRYVGLFTVRDGKLAEFAEYFDPVVFLEALGARIERSPA
jgi:ketosteroid isomerase-like protein